MSSWLFVAAIATKEHNPAAFAIPVSPFQQPSQPLTQSPIATHCLRLPILDIYDLKPIATSVFSPQIMVYLVWPSQHREYCFVGPRLLTAHGSSGPSQYSGHCLVGLRLPSAHGSSGPSQYSEHCLVGYRLPSAHGSSRPLRHQEHCPVGHRLPSAHGSSRPLRHRGIAL